MNERADSEAYFKKLHRDIAKAKARLAMTEALLSQAKKALDETDLHAKKSVETTDLEIEAENERQFLRRMDWQLMFYRRF